MTKEARTNYLLKTINEQKGDIQDLRLLLVQFVSYFEDHSLSQKYPYFMTKVQETLARTKKNGIK